MRHPRFSLLCLIVLVGLMFSLGATTPTNRTYPAPRLAEITAGANPLDPRPYSLLITASGTLTIGNRDGTTASVPVLAGQEIHCQPYKITAASGGATVVGMYV